MAVAFPELNSASSGSNPLVTESRCALACDAITNDKVHAVQSVDSYFSAFLSTFDDFLVDSERDGLFDAKVLAAIDRSKHSLNEFRFFLNVLAQSDDVQKYNAVLIDVLNATLQLKKKQIKNESSAYLWRDSLRFIAREIFLSVIAALLHGRHWRTVRTLLEHEYSIKGVEDGFRYVAFDGFLRSVDVFRNRRLKLNRQSVTADILKDRVDQGALHFNQIMQADFVLHIFSLLNPVDNSSGWVARTLSYGHDFAISGFDMFVAARGDDKNNCLADLFDVKQWSQLNDKVQAICQFGSPVSSCDPGAIDYEGYLAARNGIFNR